MISYSKKSVARSPRSKTASLLCGVLLLTPLGGNAAFADTSSVADKHLSDAISRTQNLVVSMSAGCSGGAGGVPPVNWASLQPHGNAAVNALNAAKLALARNQTPSAVQQISSAEGELDALVNGAHSNCSGGCCGVDPVAYSSYQSIRDTIKTTLEDVISFLQG